MCVADGRLYFSTNNQKPMFKQIKNNPKVEISGTAPDSRWLRLTAEAVPDNNREAKKAILDSIPSLRNMYNEDDGIFEVYYLKNAVGVICSFDGTNETHNF